MKEKHSQYNASTVFGVFVNAIYQPSMIGRIIQQEFD